MMDSPLWREGEMKLWTGRSDQINNRFGDDTFNYSIHEVNTPATLLRSMVWVTWQGYNFYTIGGDGIPQGPVGYAFGDLNSRNNHNEFPPNNGQGNDKTELIAYDEQAAMFSPLGWPPNTTGDLSGSINSIDSSGTLATTENLNAFMYTSAHSFVDSKAQRIFDEEPEFSLVLIFFGTDEVSNPLYKACITIRQLWSFSG